MARNRRRDREEQQTNRIIDLARKEFSGKDDIRGLKDELGALKSNLIGIGILGVAALLLVMWDRLTTLTGGRDGNRET
jgi:hypothetical protein